MPRLIVQRSGRRRTIPPCGRLIEYKEPHSPFQKLIDGQRRRYGLSGRDLADRIGVSQSSLWIWLHNVNGHPHPKAFKPHHLRALSRALKIPEAKIRTAIDASRHLFTPTEDPMPHKMLDAMDQFIQILENDKRVHVSKSYVLNLAKNLRHGAKVTLLMFALSLAAVSADELQTLVTTTGHRFEKARVTEVTATSITIRHATGLARVPLSEFPPEIQRKFGYDEAKTRAAYAEAAKQQQAQEAAAEWKRKHDRARARATYAETQERLEHARAMINAVYDQATGRWYPSAEEAARAREAALRSR